MPGGINMGDLRSFSPELPLTAEVREQYPLDPDFGPHTTRLRTNLHRLCDAADDLAEALEEARLIVANLPHDESLFLAKIDAALAKARGES